MNEEFESLASASAANKNLGGGLEVSLLRDYVEDLERRQLEAAQKAQELKAENEQRAKDQADVYFYLNKKLDDNYDVINNLEEQIIREQNEREISEKEYENALEAAQAKMASEEARYKSKIFELEDKLEQVREFMGKKEDYEKELTELRTTIEKDHREFKERYEGLDKSRILEKKQLREEFEMEIASIKKHHAADIESKLSAKAKKSMIMNTMYKKELKYQTLQAEEVLVHDKEIMQRDRNRRNELELSKGMEDEMQKKLTEYQRTIKNLTKRLEEGNVRLSDTSAQDELSSKYEQKCEEYQNLLVQFEALRQDASADKERYGKIWNVLMNHYYDYQKRGVRRPLNKIEIEADPERFVVELLFGVFESNPSRFKKAIRKQMGGSSTTGNRSGKSFFAAEDNRNDNDLHDDSLSLLPDEHKWWSTQNTAYLTSPNSPDFAIVKDNPGSKASGFSVPSSTSTARGVMPSKSAQSSRRNRRNASVQTDESSFVTAQESIKDSSGVDGALSIASSNFVIDSFSAPNLRAGGSEVLSASGSSVFMDSFAGASVDRGIGGNMLSRKVIGRNRSYDPVNFTRKKKVSKKVILPRMNHLATPPTPQTDFSISGHPAIVSGSTAKF